MSILTIRGTLIYYIRKIIISWVPQNINYKFGGNNNGSIKYEREK